MLKSALINALHGVIAQIPWEERRIYASETCRHIINVTVPDDAEVLAAAEFGHLKQRIPPAVIGAIPSGYVHARQDLAAEVHAALDKACSGRVRHNQDRTKKTRSFINCFQRLITRV